MANVNLHFDVQRQAITDDLTGLASHGHFQDLLGAEMEEVRRYQYPVGLIMLDIDNFKSVNDVHGHQQGDLVLRCVADALRETSRDVDVAARYGGEEMALILPHTDLEGAFEMAERARMAIAAMEIPLLEGDGMPARDHQRRRGRLGRGQQGRPDRRRGWGALRGQARRQEPHRES